MTALLSEAARARFLAAGKWSAQEVAALVGAGSAAEGLPAAWLALVEEAPPLAAMRAQAPVSAFHVGAVAVGQICPEAGAPALYLGANLECAGLPLAASVHAEQAAAAAAWAAGETGLLAIAASAPPCGHCRQFLCELGDPTELRIVVPGEPERRLAALLPQWFGPEQLGVNQTWMQRTFAVQAQATVAEQAVAAARSSFSPYSGVLQGLALEYEDGAVIAGATVESVAYNPSLTAFAMALSRAAMQRNAPPWAALRRVVLAESSGATSLRASIEAALAQAAPGCGFERIEVQSGQAQ